MTSYIARTGGQKKRNILRQRELELRGEINRGGPDGKIRRKAERVRSAQLGVIKALIEEATPVSAEQEERFRNRRQKHLKNREFWKGITVEEIVRMYSESNTETHEVNRKRWWDFRERLV